WSGHIAFWHLLLLAFAQGCLVAVDLPARQALVVELVSKERYHEAMPLNSFAFNFSRLAGPALAGLCISTLGMAWSFWINALTFVPFLFTLPLLPNRPGGKAKGTALLGGLLGGFHYILETPLVRQLLLLLGWVSLFGVNFMTLIPAYAKLVLHLEVQGYGLLMSSLGLGALAGSSWQILSAKARPGRILKSIFALALLHIALAIELPVWAVGAIWAGCGFCMATVLINTNTSLQTLIPDELRGRITAIYTMLLLGATPIGSWLTGMLFDRCGGRITAGLLGLFTGLGLVLALRVELPKELQAVNSEEGARI
ncbi:MAG TPA: MFS transporter, partial [Candidatus Obscuribacterales bacterium]